VRYGKYLVVDSHGVLRVESEHEWAERENYDNAGVRIRGRIRGRMMIA
jgi:hypothetical protein